MWKRNAFKAEMASSLKSGRPRSHKAASASSTNSSNPFGLRRAQFRMAWISVDAAAPEGPDVAAAHNGPVQTRDLGQAPRDHRLARARRAEQQ